MADITELAHGNSLRKKLNRRLNDAYGFQRTSGGKHTTISLSIAECKSVIAALGEHLTLAAENVALKSFGDKLNDMHNALKGEGTGIQGRAEVACQQVALEAAIEEFHAIETTATDRIVAGIKADGVEEFAESQKEYVRQHRNEMGQVLRAAYAGSAVDAERFAKQLREGADK